MRSNSGTLLLLLRSLLLLLLIASIPLIFPKRRSLRCCCWTMFDWLVAQNLEISTSFLCRRSYRKTTKRSSKKRKETEFSYCKATRKGSPRWSNNLRVTWSVGPRMALFASGISIRNPTIQRTNLLVFEPENSTIPFNFCFPPILSPPHARDAC